MQIDALTPAGTHPVAHSQAIHPPGTVSSLPTRQDGTPSTATTPGQPATPWSDGTQQVRTVMTADMMQSELMSMGIEPNPQNVAVAQSLAKLGVPLTPQAMVEAHASLAAAGAAALPQSFALSKVLGLPPSPGVLRGLSTVMASSTSVAQTHGSVFSMLQSVLPAALAQQASMPVDAVIQTAEIAQRRDIPLELLQRIGLTFDFNATPAAMAIKMQAYSRQVLRSTENRIAQALMEENGLGEIHDLRTLLLKMAMESPDSEVREGAAALASHIEGQQLINIGAQQRANQGVDANTIAYVAMPLVLAGQQSFVEMRLWPHEEKQGNWTDEDAYPVKATLRLTMTNLGRVQADILGDLTGYLNCRLSAEKTEALQLISRNSTLLSTMLTNAGWTKNEVACTTKGDWSPLWTGGEALVKPRQRVDWRA